MKKRFHTQVQLHALRAASVGDIQSENIDYG